MLLPSHLEGEIYLELDKKNMARILLIIFISILLLTVSQNLRAVISTLSSIVGILAPFIIGIGMAFIINVPLRFLERRVLSHVVRSNSLVWRRLRRPVCLLISVLLIFGIFSLVLLIVVPEVKATIVTLAKVLPTRAKDMLNSMEQWLLEHDVDTEVLDTFEIDWNSISRWISEKFTTQGSTVVIKTLDLTSGIVRTVFDLGLGFVFSLYLLASKERLAHQAARLCFAVFDKRVARRILEISSLASDIFSRFVVGQITTALILGVLCYVGMRISGMPYAMTISSLIAVTAFIPIFGAIIGTSIGAVMILLENPIQAFGFVIFIIVLQQIDNNVIYPKVVGSSVGLPGIWVLLAVTLGGGLFGVLGMILSVPLSSVLYCLLREFMDRRLKR